MRLTDIELLAPAGSMEGLAAAYRFGADAAYIGGPMLQLRAGSAGFSLDDVRAAARHARDNDKKLYVAVNAFVFPEEIERVGEYARALSGAGVHALIASDIGAIREIKRAAKDIDVHLSTQANLTNHITARVVYDMGVTRIVPARELSIEQIAELRTKTPAALEIEAFVHGAMCMAYSGRCLLSSFLTGRSANRGGCAQSCRWKYALTEEKRPGQYFEVQSDARGDTILSSYDLCALPLLDKLARAGVSAFKIEGRMKTPYYVATVVNAYRQRLSGAREDICMAELNAISHRPYSSGFYLGDMKTHTPAPEGYAHTRVYAANVLARADGNRIRIALKNKIEEGARIEALTPARAPIVFTAQHIQNEAGERVRAASIPSATYTLDAPNGIHKGDFLRTIATQ